MSNNSSCVCYKEYVYKIVDATKYEIIDYKNNNNNNYNSTNLAYTKEPLTVAQTNNVTTWSPLIGSTEPPANMHKYPNFTPSDH